MTSREFMCAFRRSVALAAAAALIGGGCTHHTPARVTPTFTGPVNRRGTVTVPHVAGQPTALEVELTEFAFTPTVVRITAGTALTVQLRNRGTEPHTFTVTSAGYDVVVQPGQTATQAMTNFTTGEIPFFCRFHRARGMQGAFVVGKPTDGGAH